MKFMNKRGAYFFVIDALIASTVVFLSLIIIFTTYGLQPETGPSLRALEDYTNYLINTKIRQFQGSYVGSLINDSNITNLDNSLLDQLTEFFYLNESGKDRTVMMANFTDEISKGVVPQQMSFAVYLNNTISGKWLLVYNKTNNPEPENSKVLLSTKKISFKRINETYIYGPILLEVRIWI